MIDWLRPSYCMWYVFYLSFKPLGSYWLSFYWYKRHVLEIVCYWPWHNTSVPALEYCPVKFFVYLHANYKKCYDFFECMPVTCAGFCTLKYIFCNLGHINDPKPLGITNTHCASGRYEHWEPLWLVEPLSGCSESVEAWKASYRRKSFVLFYSSLMQVIACRRYLKMFSHASNRVDYYQIVGIKGATSMCACPKHRKKLR